MKSALSEENEEINEERVSISSLNFLNSLYIERGNELALAYSCY